MRYILGPILFSCVISYGITAFAQSAQDTKIAQLIPPPPEVQSTPASVPQNCGKDGFTVQDKQLIFNNDQATPRVFLLHNTSQGIVMLSHVQSISGAGVEQSKLDQDKWALIFMSASNFSMGCMLYKPPSISYVPCPSVVSVCSIPTTVSFGNMWVVENSSLQKVVDALKIRGM